MERTRIAEHGSHYLEQIDDVWTTYYLAHYVYDDSSLNCHIRYYTQEEAEKDWPDAKWIEPNPLDNAEMLECMDAGMSASDALVFLNID